MLHLAHIEYILIYYVFLLFSEKDALPPFLKPETMKLLWTPVIKTSEDGDGTYGLGWSIFEGIYK